MRLTKEKAAENRQSIIDAASRLFRQRGFDGVGLNDLMKEAGFTQGGFYNHFSSKEELAGEAAAAGIRVSNSRLAKSELPQAIERYLSPKHRDNRDEGCTFAALASDAARQGKQVQASFAEGINEELNILAGQFGKSREEAVQLLSEMVGAVILARAVADADPSLSDEILQANRRKLLV
jgi:TetR/AcrR family transcriptional regulator, transcriptional repressor for nem operon